MADGLGSSRDGAAVIFRRAALDRWRLRSGGQSLQQLSVAVPQLKLRTAGAAGVRLGVEAAVERVVVFGLALRTHDEALHRSVGTVVRQRLDDAEARAAVGAIGERVTVAAVMRIEDLGEAIRAGGDVREHQRGPGPVGIARTDRKARVADRVEPGGFEALDGAARRSFSFEAEQKRFQRRTGAFDFNEDALRRVVHPTGQPGPGGEPVNEWAEAHALDRTADRDL